MGQQLNSFYILMIIMMAFSVYADNLQVKIVSPRSIYNKAEGVIVNLQYTNNGNQTLYINKWCLPETEALEDRVFKVMCNGTVIDYIGRLFKRAAPTINETIALAPGQTVSTRIQLSSAYNLSKTCTYSIQYDMSTDRVVFQPIQTSRAISGSVMGDDLQSNSIQLNIEGRPTSQLVQTNISQVQQRAASLSYISCSSTRIAQISLAFSSARTYADSSFSYLSNTKPSSTARYLTWFGAFTTTNWNTVKAHYQKIKDAFSSQRIVFDCGCTTPNTYAYVYPTRPYNIYLCPSFWSALSTGTDSKAGTIIHETSHFAVIASTQDYAYGQAACKNLASGNSQKAIMNADSHEYFTENNPSLK